MMRSLDTLARRGAVRIRAALPLVALASLPGALAATLAGCAAAPAPASPKVLSLPVPGPTLGAPAPPSFRALALTGRHGRKRAYVGPGGRVYVAAMDELFIFAPGDPTTGDRVPFRGTLASPPGGARLYRAEKNEVFELDAAGADARKITFGSDVVELAFSPTGAMVTAYLRPPTGGTVVLVRASDLTEIARVPMSYGGIDRFVWSPDDAYVAMGDRVIDPQTGAAVYEHRGVDRSAIVFEGGRMHWLFRDLLESVDLATKTSTQTWLPCWGDTRVEPAAHRFITACEAENFLTTVGSGPPAITRAPSTPLDREASRGTVAAPQWSPPGASPGARRFAYDARGSVLLEGLTMALRDGELQVPTKGAPATLAARVRLGPAAPRAADSLTAEVRGDAIVVLRGDRSELASFPQDATPEGVTVVGDKVVVMRPGWNPAEAPRDARVCTFAGVCEPKFERAKLLGLFGDELVATRIGNSGPVLARVNVRTGATSELAVPVSPTLLGRSEDGGFFVGIRAKAGRPTSTFFSVDARTGKVAARVETDDPSYSALRFVGAVGDRVVVAPDVSNYAEVVLHDARTLREEERWLVGKDGTLHVRDDGTFETTGDATELEGLIVCTAGRRFGPPALCRHGAR